MYLPDLKVILESNFLAPAAVVVADNVIFPGAPEYLEYIRASPRFDSVNHPSHLEYSTTIVDAIEVSTFKG
jgi:catechol O-methyltransferase